MIYTFSSNIYFMLRGHSVVILVFQLKYWFIFYCNISQVDRGEREIRHLTQTQVFAIIWTVLLTWLRTKNGGCVSHDVKKNIQNTKQQKINENVLMLLFLFEINSMESIKRRFMFNFLVIAQKCILIFYWIGISHNVSLHKILVW